MKLSEGTDREPRRDGGREPQNGFQGKPPEVEPALIPRAGKLSKQQWVEVFKVLYERCGHKTNPPGSWIDAAELLASELKAARKARKQGRVYGGKP